MNFRKCKRVFWSEEDSKKLLAEELADIIGLAIMNTSMFEIDLEYAIKEKWLDRA